ncbi:MAG: UDP-glycosyltransferase [Ramlibacter sp.]|nr:UDP-glycosyltransferase [Ramlibacter sp.]
MRADKPCWLFVAYGGGHVRALLPVAQQVRALGLAEPRVLALTTAAYAVREAGFLPLGFADFVRQGDDAALVQGLRMAQVLPAAPLDLRESSAYLGLSYADLEARYGAEQAAERYARDGRQCFEPVGVMERILREIAPALVVTTSAPRAEKATVLAARRLGIPAACVVDLFAVDEVGWVGQPGFADRICVLNERVRERVLAAGRQAQEVVVTGNPAFDAVNSIEARNRGVRLRREQGWDGAQVVLWASQPEPLSHPSVPGRSGDPDLPGRIEASLVNWAGYEPNRVLVVRPHPSEPERQAFPLPGVRWDGRQFELHPLIHAADVLVTMNSTVAVEAWLAGTPVIQVLGSLFDDSVPLARYGMATACRDPARLDSLLRAVGTGRGAAGSSQGSGQAATRVLAVLKELVK